MVAAPEELGFGTFRNTDPKECTNSVKSALTVGYRHIDTAQRYENEEYVGEALKQSNVNRKEVLLATKLWPGNLAPKKVRPSTEQSLERLSVDYIDLLYVHWPAIDYDAEGTLSAFAELQDEGLIEHIAVSNFTIKLLEEAQDVTDVEIFANQVELHPRLQQEELRKYCSSKDMYIVAYSPLAKGDVFDIPEINDIAKKHNASEAQITLAWLHSIDQVIPIPKATSKSHIMDNYKSINLKLDRDDIDKIEAISDEHRYADRDWVDW